jgi:C4-dicarboxylate transporter DctQ subunit
MKNIFNFIDGILGNTIDFINKFIATIGITGGVALAFANVVARYGFDYSLTWASELTVYLFLWSMFFASAYLFKINGHITIDLFVQSLSKKNAKLLLLFNKTITLVFLTLVAYFGYEYLELVIELDERSVDLEIAMWIPYLVIPVSFAFAAYGSLTSIIELISTPSEELVFQNEADEIMEENNIEQLVKEVEKKTGGML